MASGNQKLSKSAGATSVHYLRGEGKAKADIFTDIAEILGVEGPVSDWEE